VSDSPACGVEAAIAVVGGRWKPLILCALEQRTHRFGELRRALGGVTEKVLAEQLRELEADGIVDRRAFDELVPRVEYSLSEVGAELLAALAPLGMWGEARMERLGLGYTPGGRLGACATAP
jgi:DNA-binding HxlR family transcriptional regulator